MSDNGTSFEWPPPPSNDTWPCPACEWHVNDEILLNAPECPHGWVSLEDKPMSEIKALFADAEDGQEGPLLSIDPTIGDQG